MIASAGTGPAAGRRPSELDSGRRASGAVLPFHGGAKPVDNSAGWSGKVGALLTTCPHQVDRRQQVSGETDYDQQYGDSEREGGPLGRATWSRAGSSAPDSQLPRGVRPRGRRKEPPSRRAARRWRSACRAGSMSGRSTGSAPRRSSPARSRLEPKMISHGAHASQRRLPGGGAPASAAMAAGSPTLSRRVRTLAVSSGSSPVRPSSMCSCTSARISSRREASTPCSAASSCAR